MKLETFGSHGQGFCLLISHCRIFGCDRLTESLLLNSVVRILSVYYYSLSSGSDFSSHIHAISLTMAMSLRGLMHHQDSGHVKPFLYFARLQVSLDGP